MAVSFSSFLIFLVICNANETRRSHPAEEEGKHNSSTSSSSLVFSYTLAVTQTPHLLHLLFEGGEDLVALGQSGLKLFKLLCVQRQLESNTTQV